MQTLPLGDGHWLVVDSASGGWKLEVGSGENSSGVTLLTPRTMDRLMNKGATLCEDPMEVRGLRWEIEFRLEGKLVGRIRKDVFELALSSEPPG